MRTMGILFSNIYDSSLGDLTNVRTVASLPFGGRYRQIDFTLSNMSNSGIYSIGIITKYNYRSLMDHLGNCADWDLNRKNEGIVFLPPFATGNTGVYKGKLEALYSAINFIDNPAYDYVVVSDSTVLCNMDFRPAIRQHIRTGSDVTIMVNHEPDADKKHPLVLRADESNKVTEIRIDSQAAPESWVGMGMFIFTRKHLVSALQETYSKGMVHLERDYLQKRFNEHSLNVSLCPFEGVVLRNENVKSFFANNMKLLDKDIHDGLFRQDRLIYTKVRDEAPAYYIKGSHVSDCLVADGCYICGNAEKSVLFRNVTLEKDACVRSCVVMQGAVIGSGASLEYVILDKNVTVRPGTVLKGTFDHPIVIKKGETV